MAPCDRVAGGVPLDVLGGRGLPAAEVGGEGLADTLGPRHARPGLRAHGTVLEVDEAGRPATTALGDGAPVEVAAPAVLGDHDLATREHLLDVGDVAAGADAVTGVPPRDRADHRLLVGDAAVGVAPVVGHAGGVPRALGRHPVLDQPVGDVVRAVVAGVHPPPHLVARTLVAEVGVARVRAAGVTGAEVGGRRLRRGGGRQEGQHPEHQQQRACPRGHGGASGPGGRRHKTEVNPMSRRRALLSSQFSHPHHRPHGCIWCLRARDFGR